MPAHTKLWYFERFRMISALNEAQRRQLEKLTRMLEVKRGTRIYLPGDPSDQIFLLKSGVIKISTTTADNREVILAFLHPGDIFGELAVVDEAPRDHVAEAYDDCVICAMNRDTIVRVIHETPEIGFQITKLIGLRLRTFRSRIEELLSKSAHARVAHALLELAERHGVVDNDGVLISLRLKQRDLGRLVGLSRETVNAILREWREQNLVEMDRRTVRLRDPDQLRRISTQAGTGEIRPDSSSQSQ
jgi:CRP/FNR family transcriptional regulator, cyclic AMP receptor protein